ncbi:MAG: trehalose-6-phosphate synthase, partial [Psychrobacter sp.]|nr:trehalose-6-phosphate synthase [Psychrobacter sp.]
GIWMGWNGDIIDSDKSFDNDFSTRHQHGDSNITYMTTALSTEQYQQFYCGFANNVLWPLLHEQSHLICQSPSDYQGYQSVNRLFAEQLKQIIEPNDVIWVHDYHFLSVAYHCRQLGISNRIGFFLHIPFAPLSGWQYLEQSAQLINHLAHYDVVGVQTKQDKANCLAVFEHYFKNYLKSCLIQTPISLSASNGTDNNDVSAFDSLALDKSECVTLTVNIDAPSPALHELTINTYPIGVDVTKIQQQVSHLSSSDSLESPVQTTTCHPQQKHLMSANQQIIAVDRIDYSKGLLERFSAYQDFLTQYPVYQNQLKFLQIACPSRLDLPIYQQLYNEVKQAVGQVNEKFSSRPPILDTKTDCFNNKANPNQENGGLNNWQAVTYSEGVLSHQALMTAFWQSDVGWVNSLKDGMNLVAKEFVAAQNPTNPGVLVLSKYAGAAEQMQAAVIIDSHDPKSIIEGLRRALTMSLAERQERYRVLLRGLQQEDLSAWQRHFLTDLYGNSKQ